MDVTERYIGSASLVPCISIVFVSQDLLNELLGICGVGVHVWLGSRKGSESHRICG